MKVLFAAAGTAGHVNPAIALAELIKEQDRDAEFLFLVTPTGMEKGLIENAGYATEPVEVRGIQRKLTLENLRAIHLFVRAGRHIRAIISGWHPDLIIGTGGYMSYPAVTAGKSAGIPCILHESNAVPGLAVRLLAKKASLVLGGFPTTGDHLPRKCKYHYVGTPVRRSFHQTSRAKARASLGLCDGDFLIAAVGGSLGAKRLNNAIIKSFSMLNQGRQQYKMIVGTGKRFYDDCAKQLAELGEIGGRLHIVPYIQDMATVLSAADLVISRGGAATITELSVVGTPSIIVPYPSATNDHQTKNASAFQAIGACRMISESELTAESLANCVKALRDDQEMLRQMRRNTRRLQPKNRDKMILSLIENLVL